MPIDYKAAPGAAASAPLSAVPWPPRWSGIWRRAGSRLRRRPRRAPTTPIGGGPAPVSSVVANVVDRIWRPADLGCGTGPPAGGFGGRECGGPLSGVPRNLGRGAGPAAGASVAANVVDRFLASRGGSGCGAGRGCGFRDTECFGPGGGPLSGPPRRFRLQE